MNPIQWLGAAVSTFRNVAKLELQKELIEARATIDRQQQEIRDLAEANREREALLAQRTQMRHARNAYWIGEGYAEANGPYCSPCFDKDRHVIHMTVNGTKRETAQCPTCKSAVRIDDPRGRDETPHDTRRPDTPWVDRWRGQF